MWGEDYRDTKMSFFFWDGWQGCVIWRKPPAEWLHSFSSLGKEKHCISRSFVARSTRPQSPCYSESSSCRRKDLSQATAVEWPRSTTLLQPLCKLLPVLTFHPFLPPYFPCLPTGRHLGWICSRLCIPVCLLGLQRYLPLYWSGSAD